MYFTKYQEKRKEKLYLIQGSFDLICNHQIAQILCENIVNLKKAFDEINFLADYQL